MTFQNNQTQSARGAGELDAVLQVRNFCKSYRSVRAVDDLTFDLKPGEILGFIGRNGAGKTTTMRCVAGILKATRGRIVVAGSDIQSNPVKAKSRLAYVPDEPRLFDALTVWEHLQFFAATYRVENFEKPAEDLLAEFELTHRRDTLCHELSRGMRQKVAICCALLHMPDLLMFDEPLTGLDPRGIRTIKDAVRTRAARGAGVILSSHLLALVEDLCTRYLIIDRGKQQFNGSIAEAHGMSAHLREKASLEELFFEVTESSTIAE
jgi:ABC-2 type transport system ATP-binding protein